jgi:apolipoprotein N-acyltransferase
LTAAPSFRVPHSLALLLAVALGAGQTLTFVHTGGWPLALLAVAALAWLTAQARPGRAFWLGLAYGTAWLGAGTWWIFISLHVYGGLPAWMAVLAVAGLSAFLSLYLGAAMAAFARWRPTAALPAALLFGAVWLLAELARGVIFTGFPWVASGYAQVDGPLAALAPWTGVYGIGFVGAVLAAWLALATSPGRRGRGATAPVAAAALVLGGLALSGPGHFTAPSGTLSVTLLQGNVPQDEKFLAEAMPEAMAWTRDQLLSARGELVVGPETVIPLLPDQLDPVYWKSIEDHFQRGGQAALLGLPLGNDEVGYTNSAAGISSGTVGLPGGFYRYDKHHLVPFGEFIPYGFHWFTAMMNIPLGDFNRGPVGPPSFAFHGERIAPNICYEDLFGEELAARFIDPGAAPTIFANIGNIGWFGDTEAIPQHLQISRMRTLEFQLPMLRATNTGATAVIDHTGRVTASLPPFTKGVLNGEVRGRAGITPFAWWAARFGLWPLTLLALAIVWVGARSDRARRNT